MSAASTPGIELPRTSSLDAYSKAVPNHERGALSSEILLQSSAHPKLDYTAREEMSGAADSLLKHYVGVYDPSSGQVQLVPARRLVMRSTLRSATTLEDDVKEIMPSKVCAVRGIINENSLSAVPWSSCHPGGSVWNEEVPESYQGLDRKCNCFPSESQKC